jgi:soluble lytic murein transglycosylase-like protein
LPFEEFIMQAAQTYQVDPTLIRAIIMAESSYNPRAVSHRGAQGLMQLMPTTAKWLGIRDSFDPAMNIDGGVRYFRRLLDRFDGDVKLALAAYNAGSRYVRKYGGVPPFRATRIYIKKVLHYHHLLQEQMAAGGGNGLTAG